MNRALLAAAACALLVLPALAAAESVQYSGTAPSLYMFRGGSTSGTCDPILGNLTVTVAYNVSATNAQTGASVCNATVPQGTQIKLTFQPHVNQDIFWFGTGYSWDSPYGVWTPNAVSSSNDSDYYNMGGYAGAISFSANLPTQHLDNLSGLTCSAPDGSGSVTCTASSIGTFTPTFTFDSTYGYFYYGKGSAPMRTSDDSYFTGYDGTGWVFQCPSSSQWTQNITKEQISCPIHIVDPNGSAPGHLTLSGGGAAQGAGSCTVGTPYTITMRATDPDNDQIRYAVDWDGNGTVDQFLPTTGYVNSGTQESASRTYSQSGAKSIKVLVEDSRGLTSGWVSFSATCNDPASQQSQSSQSNSQGTSDSSSLQNTLPALTLRALPSLVRQGQTTTLSWSASNVLGNTCKVTSQADSAANGTGSWAGALSQGVTSSPISQQTTYTLSCTGTDHSTLTQSATVNILPNFREI